MKPRVLVAQPIAREAMVQMATHAARGIIEILEGRTPTWPVNRVSPGDRLTENKEVRG